MMLNDPTKVIWLCGCLQVHTTASRWPFHSSNQCRSKKSCPFLPSAAGSPLSVQCTCRDPRKLDICPFCSRSHCSSSSPIQGIRFVCLVLDCWIHLNLSLVQATWSNGSNGSNWRPQNWRLCNLFASFWDVHHGIRIFEDFCLCHWKPLGLNLKCYAFAQASTDCRDSKVHKRRPSINPALMARLHSSALTIGPWLPYDCHMGMDQYLYIPFLVGWTSINPSYFDVNYRGTIGFDTLPYIAMFIIWVLPSIAPLLAA